MAHKGGGANAWSVLAADPERDLVFVPTGSAAPDYYGAMRLGDNRYANSIVALRASTGRVVWAFQTVHHDLWDYDNASPPALVTMTQGRRARPGRAPGEQERNAVRAQPRNRRADLSASKNAPSRQRHPARAGIARRSRSPAPDAPLSPHRFTADQVWGLTDEDRAACRAAVEGLRNDGIFTPPSTRGTLVLPSNIGGAHWGGVAVDPVRQIAVVPVNRVAAMVQLIPPRGIRSGSSARRKSSGSATTTNTTSCAARRT